MKFTNTHSIKKQIYALFEICKIMTNFKKTPVIIFGCLTSEYIESVYISMAIEVICFMLLYNQYNG